jgi:hypothetical protein
MKSKRFIRKRGGMYQPRDVVDTVFFMTYLVSLYYYNETEQQIKSMTLYLHSNIKV